MKMRSDEGEREERKGAQGGRMRAVTRSMT